jgi:hypothetical protein
MLIASQKVEGLANTAHYQQPLRILANIFRMPLSLSQQPCKQREAYPTDIAKHQNLWKEIDILYDQP